MQLTLKANWKGTTFFTISNMQEMTSTICDAATTPNTSATSLDQTGAYSGNKNYVPSTTLIDTRDNNTYTVRKLADGKCWMTQNLRLINKTIDSSNSDISSGNFTVPSTSLSNFSGYNKNNAYLNSYGGYYSFYTATIGWGTTSITSGNSSNSICAKNWRLPTGGSTGEFKTLYSYYPSAASLRSAPVDMDFNGNIYNGSFREYEDGTFYWSSTVARDICAYFISIWDQTVKAEWNNQKDLGLSVRCVAR